jgi:magnesium-transporting ATPase (P-type)
MQSNTVVFAKRSLSLSKIQAGAGLFFSVVGVLLIIVLSHVHGISSAPKYLLFSVSFMSFGMLMFTTPVILLYVYDKNNGVLEYLLSLGWNQSDIFKQYLKAALFLTLSIFIAESGAVIIAGATAGSQVVFLLDLLMLLLAAFLGFFVVSFATVAMMAFSTLQKQRVGANTPLAFALGAVFIIPTFYLFIFLRFIPEVLVYVGLSALAAALSVVLMLLSSKLIRREKMLP